SAPLAISRRADGIARQDWRRPATASAAARTAPREKMLLTTPHRLLMPHSARWSPAASKVSLWLLTHRRFKVRAQSRRVQALGSRRAPDHARSSDAGGIRGSPEYEWSHLHCIPIPRRGAYRARSSDPRPGKDI